MSIYHGLTCLVIAWPVHSSVSVDDGNHRKLMLKNTCIYVYCMEGFLKLGYEVAEVC